MNISFHSDGPISDYFLCGTFRRTNIVVLQDDNLIPTKWPLARVLQVHPGKDRIVRVATVKTSTGIQETRI